MEQYYLAKVTYKQWAEKFQKGQIFMKALQCFGDFSKMEPSSQNTFRGDTLEGVSESFSKNRNPYTWIETPLGYREIVDNQVGLVDVLLLREKVFCMYALEYKNEHDGFYIPDSRMKDFGDTAVIITDTFEFLRRVCLAIVKKYDYSFWVACKRVSYDVTFGSTRYYNEFHKSPSYSWQNEFRIALDLALGKFCHEILDNVTDFAKLTFPGIIEEDMNPDSMADSLIIDIGGIYDISTSISTDVFISDQINQIGLKIPNAVKEIYPPRRSYPTFYKLVASL